MEAVAGMQMVDRVIDRAVLVIYLDPDSLAIMPPRDSADWPSFARLLREISAGAVELAEFLDRPRDQWSGMSIGDAGSR